ncbi:MAG: sulfurtransferase TusA family protein [Actinomycetota bacterium]|nr:sulfurtransferase TusA family protein [Actinomycetota bacterium]
MSGCCESIKADVVLDCKGQFCPMPILNTKKASKKMASGQILEVLGTDPGTERDLPAWCKRTGNDLIKMDQLGGVLHFFIKIK